MNDVKAVAASAAMVMVAALGVGGLVALQQSPVAPPAQAPQVVVEYVDVPAAEPAIESPPAGVAEAPPSPEPAVAMDEYAEHEEYEDDDEHGEDDD